MAKRNLIAGLDIGTQNIKILVAGKNKKDEELEAVYQAKENSFGVRRGVVVDVDEVSNILKILLSRVKTDIGQRIDSAYVNIGGSHLFSASSHGLVSVSRADQKISEEDIQRVLQAAQTFSLPSNKEIFDTLPREFSVDGQGGIKDVLGLQGVRLEADVLVLGGFAPYLKNLTQAVLGADLQILDVIPSPIAGARACLSKKQKEIGTAILDIGAGTSSLAVFNEGDLVHLSVLPIGSANITNDIAIGLKTDIDIAERIKIEYGSCVFKGKDHREKIETGEEEMLTISQKHLAGIIGARVTEIFREVNKELKQIGGEKFLSGGMVLTGGCAMLPYITELARKEFKLPCRLGRLDNFLNLTEKDSSWITCCGLALLGSDSEGIKSFSLFGKTIGSGFKKIFRIFMP